MYEIMTKQRQNIRNRGRGGISLTQQGSNIINPNWILLDPCSTENVFCNKDFLIGVRKCGDEEDLKIISNGGFRHYQEIGIAKILPLAVHYNPDSLANVLSYRAVSKLPNICITADTDLGPNIHVHVKDTNTKYIFRPCGDDIYYIDMHKIRNSAKNNLINVPVIPYNDFFLQ